MAQNTPPQQSPFETLPQAVPHKLEEAVGYFIDNIKLFAVGAVLLLVAVGAMSAFNSWRASSQRQALNELTTIAAKGDIAALAAFAEKSPAGARVPAYMELARIAMDKKDYQAAANAWRAISEQAKPGLASVAVLGQAQALELAGKPTDALNILQAAQQGSPENFKHIMLRQRALAAELAGKADEAAAAYRELLQLLKDNPREAEYIQYKLAQPAKPAANS